MPFPHSLHLYEKPAEGTAFIKRCPVYNYRHKIAAVGWFDSASCDLALTQSESEVFLERYIGNRVAIYVDNPVEPIWEGFISRITFQVGTVTFTNSLDGMTNRLALTYQNPNAAAPERLITTYDDNLSSQAIYGIKESILQLNVDPQTGTTRRDALKALRLAVRSWPMTSTVFNSEGRQNLLHIEMQGFYKTLDWDHYASTATTNVDADVIVTTVVQGNINGMTFFDDTDVSLIEPNGSFVVRPESQIGMTRWQYLQSIQEAGDGVNRWIMGISPTDPNLGTRRFYYRQASTTVKYTVRQHDGLGVIRNVYGQAVDPWRIVPDGAIRLQDVLVGWDLTGDDPRKSYLAAVQYDAERQSVSWQSEDDVTLEGIFQLSTLYNPVESTAGVAKASPVSFYG